MPTARRWQERESLIVLPPTMVPRGHRISKKVLLFEKATGRVETGDVRVSVDKGLGRAGCRILVDFKGAGFDVAFCLFVRVKQGGTNEPCRSLRGCAGRGVGGYWANGHASSAARKPAAAAIAMTKSRLVSRISGLLMERLSRECVFSDGDAQDSASLNGLMNDKQDEERHDHKHGEQQRGGNAPEQACGCGGDWAGRPLGRKRRIQNADSGSFARRSAAAGGGGLRVKLKFVFSEVAGHGRKCYSVAEKLSRKGGRQLRR